MLLTLLQSNYRSPLDLITGLMLIDLLVNPLYILCIMSISYVIAQKFYPNALDRSYLINGMAAKIFASFLFALVYVYYYNGRGDTFYYYDGAKAVRDAFYHSPLMGIKVLMAESGVFTDETFPYTSRIPTFWRGNTEVVFMCKIAGVIAVGAFQSYWLLSFLIASLSFIGNWKMFRFFAELYPSLRKHAAYSVLFVPSALFWGSGLLKDTVCFSALGWMLFSVLNIFVRNKNVISSGIVLILSGYIIFRLKAYILYAFLPALFIWLFMRFRPKNEGVALKFALTPIMLAAVIGGLGLIVQGLGSSSDKYAIGELGDRAKGFQDYHTRLSDQGQAGYTLGEVEFTPTGIVSSFPAAVNVTYFRPYPWEVRDAVQALSALESLFFLSLFLHTLYSVGFLRSLKISFNNPDVALCLIFSLIFGFAVGVTAYNFGALVRFKIPGLAFFLMAFWIIRHEHRRMLQEESTDST